MLKPCVLVTGGAGYVGAVLVPKLLEKGYQVRVLDLYLYGDNVFDDVSFNSNLEQIRGDIRDNKLLEASVSGCEMVIHLACISNDPSCDLDPQLTQSVNYDAFVNLLECCRKEGVKRFVFASSASVYGVSDKPNVTEEHPRVPVSSYNRVKAMCEDALEKHDDPNMAWVTIRPATICGYSPRQRLDLTVNILTNHALNNRKITVFGGSQMRPNIHIDDITDLYVNLLEMPIDRINRQTFNAGFENVKVQDLATTVRDIVQDKVPSVAPVDIVTTPSDDIRSYHVSSDKIKEQLGFVPTRTISDGVTDLLRAFQSGKLPDSMNDIRYYNIKLMQSVRLR